MMKKKILGLLLLTGSCLFSTGGAIASSNYQNNQETNINETIEEKDLIETTEDGTLTGTKLKDVKKASGFVGKDSTLAYSQTFVQLITKENGQQYLRYAAAVKGSFNDIYWTRTMTVAEGDTENEATKRVEVSSVYKGITSGEKVLYYSTDGLTETQSNEYVWVVYIIQFGTETYKNTDISIQLNIVDENGKTIQNTAKSTSLNSEIAYFNTENFWNNSTISAADATDEHNEIDATQFFSFNEEGKIVNTSKYKETTLHIGSETGNKYTATDFYITPKYGNAIYSSITLRFRAKSVNTNYVLGLKDDDFGATIDSETKEITARAEGPFIEAFEQGYDNDETHASYYDEYKTDTHHFIENLSLNSDAPTSIENNTKYHIQIISNDTWLGIFIDDVLTYSTDLITRTEGYFEIYTWQTEYTLENAFYKEYDSETALRKDYGTIVKTKATRFYNGLTMQSDDGKQDYSEYFTFADDKISSNNKTGFTQFYTGKQEYNTASIADFYITVDYDSSDTASNIGLLFRAWDSNTCLKITFKDSGMTEYGKIYWDSNIENVTIEPKVNTGLKQGQKHHVQVLCLGWTKSVRIDDTLVWKYDASDFCTGKFEITSWKAAYTIEDAFYTDCTENEFRASSYYAKLWN